MIKYKLDKSNIQFNLYKYKKNLFYEKVKNNNYLIYTLKIWCN